MKSILKTNLFLSTGLLVTAMVSACTAEIRGVGSPRYLGCPAKAVLVGEVVEIANTPKAELKMGANY
jgi:hypothetical protein